MKKLKKKKKFCFKHMIFFQINLLDLDHWWLMTFGMPRMQIQSKCGIEVCDSVKMLPILLMCLYDNQFRLEKVHSDRPNVPQFHLMCV